MANPLLNALRKNDKRGLFNPSQTSISYKTGFLPFDYRNGFKIDAYTDKDEYISSHSAIGLVGGSFTTIIGKSGTAKTTFAIQAGAAMVKPFEAGLILHFDLEQALSYTRIRNVTGYSQQELMDKYILKQEDNYIDDIFDSIIDVCQKKEENPDVFKYDTGVIDEFGKPIKMYVPTVVIIDSIPVLAIKQNGKMELEGSTYANRIAKEIAQFYKKLMPMVKKYNINVITINHINTKIEINSFAKTQPQVMYLKMDESLPGGNAPVYFANTLVKFVSMSPKCTVETDGFDGFKVRAELIKSRTNKAGQSCTLVYNQFSGFDPIMTQYEYAVLNNLVEGRNPYRKFVGFPDVKFDARKLREEMKDNELLGDALFKCTIPVMDRNLEVGTDVDNTGYITGEMFEKIFDVEDSVEDVTKK